MTAQLTLPELEQYLAKAADLVRGSIDQADFKSYEADMRFLLDTYIKAGASQVVSNFEDSGLIDLIVKLGHGAIDKLPPGIKKSREAVAETIVNNMRKVIIDEHALNPKFYDRMSELLDAILEERRKQAIEYEEYLAKILEAVQQLGNKDTGKSYPSWVKNEAQRALVDTLEDDTDLAHKIDSAVRYNKQHGWMDNRLKAKKVRLAIARQLPQDDPRLEVLFKLVRGHDDYS